MTPHYVVFVNGYDLLEKALASLQAIRESIVIVDNRDIFTQQPSPPLGYQTFKPEFPLCQAQLLTLLALRCQRDGFEWFTWSHHDAASIDGTIERLRLTADSACKALVNWGLIFTYDPGKPQHGPWNHVDAMCAVNVNAVLSQGGWAWYRFPDYFSDYDLYGKLRKAGYEMIQSGLPIDHMNGGSTTAAADGDRSLVKERRWQSYMQLWADRKAELGIDWPPQ